MLLILDQVVDLFLEHRCSPKHFVFQNSKCVLLGEFRKVNAYSFRIDPVLLILLFYLIFRQVLGLALFKPLQFCKLGSSIRYYQLFLLWLGKQFAKVVFRVKCYRFEQRFFF